MRNRFSGLASIALLCMSSFARAEYVGDYAVGTDNICATFNTFQPTTGATFTLAAEALDVYKDDSLTQDADDSGISIDDDFDGVTGRHLVCVDTSSDGTFYSSGSMFEVMLTAGTVDSVSIAGTTVLKFSLEKTSALRPTTAGRELEVDAEGNAGADVEEWAGTDVATPTTAGVPEVDVTFAEGTDFTDAFDARLAAIRLDELLAADSDIDGAAPPTVGSVFHEALTKTAGSFTYDQTTDSPEAIRDRGDAAWVTGGGGACTADVGCIDDGTAAAVTGTSITLDGTPAFGDDIINNATVVIASATLGTGQSRLITNFASNVATVDTWTTTPTGTVTYRVFATPPGSTNAPVPADAVRFSGDSTAADNAELFFDGTGYAGGTTKLGVDTVALSGDTGAADNAEANFDGTGYDDLTAGEVDAADFATDVDAEILSYIVDDTARIDASDLNSKIDSLTFTVAGQVDSNVQYVNDVALTGDGSATPFNVASFRDFRKACELLGANCAEYTRGVFRTMQARADKLNRQPSLIEVVARL